MIKVQNLLKKYDKTPILTDFNLTLDLGESLAITGESGCGKSTLLNILGGLDSFDDGEVIVCKHNLGKLNADKLGDFRAKNLGFIYQFHHLLLDFTALENVALPLLINNIDTKQAHKSAFLILAKVGLIGKENNFPAQLSGGERQRVAIARALINKPKLILADEPTGNLDAKNAKKCMDLLLQLQQENNASLIIVTHDENIAKKTDNAINLMG